MSDFRDKLQEGLDARYDQLVAVIDEAMSAKRTVWTTCQHCNRRTETQIADTKAAIAAAEFLANQSLGRPGVAEGDGDQDRVKIIRATIYRGIGPEPFDELANQLSDALAAHDVPASSRAALSDVLENIEHQARQHTEHAA